MCFILPRIDAVPQTGQHAIPLLCRNRRLAR
jgi:hypothetical protein